LGLKLNLNYEVMTSLYLSVNSDFMFLVMIGPPGAGKGTQAKRLAETLGLSHVSTGEIFRQNISRKTELGLRVKELLEDGTLVPDDLTIELVQDKIDQLVNGSGAIFDGFPRNLEQAKALDDMLLLHDKGVDLAPLINLSDSNIIERLTGRRTDKDTGKIYHLIYDPPPDNANVEQRSDDKRDTVLRRIEDYHQSTVPMLAYYDDRDLLCEIDGDNTIDQVTTALLEVIRGRVFA